MPLSRHLSQTLAPFFRGEDRRYDLTGTSADDPTGWVVTFTVAARDGTTIEGAVGRTVTGTGPYTCVFACTLASADTADFPVYTARFQLARTDAGSVEMLAAGHVDCLAAAPAIP